MYFNNPSHIDHIKCINAGLVYKIIDQMGQISRIELSKLSRLAPASITKITRELIDAGLIKQTRDQSSSSRGRPATGLVVEYDLWQFLSVRIGIGVGTMALHSMDGRILIDLPFVIKETRQEMLSAAIIKELDAFFKDYSQHIQHIICVAITVNGQIDAVRGIVKNMPHYHVSDWDIVSELHRETNLPILLDKDVHAWALAEYIFGNGQDVENSVLISAQQAVSSAIMLDGNVVNSSHSNVGDIGNISIPLIDSNERAPLGSLVSWSHLISRTEEILEQGQTSSIQGKDISIDNICYAAKDGDPVCQKVIKEFGFYIGKAIAVLVNIFNPEKILIGGEVNIAKDIFYPEILNVIQKEVSAKYFERLRLDQTLFYSEATMPGAALVKQKLYEGELLLQIVENTGDKD